ncbi:DUF2254 domain-containing protein [Sporosarcina sp. CAU 1771]
MMVRRFFAKIHESIWFVPSVYALLATLLALVTVLIDTTFNKEVISFIPSYFRTSVDLAQTILATISGALLTMTTLTFSTIMVVLTLYSSQFSPRTLQNFLNSPTTQRVLGIFMGGFVYSILSLLFMRKQPISHEVISASVSVILAVICLAFFAYFIHNVGNSVQVSRLIRELVEDVLRTIEQEKKETDSNAVLWVEKKPSYTQKYSQATEIQSPSFGYVRYIDYGKLAEWAAHQEVVVEIITPVGTFAGTQSYLISIYHNGELPHFNVSSYFTLGEERSILQDIEYGIETIAEIAIRALSPGINDPNTAIRCIHSLGEVLQQASHLSGGVSVTYSDENTPCLVVTRPQTKDYFYSALSQISFYGKEDVNVLSAMLDMLLYIASSNSTSLEKRKDVQQMVEYIWNRFEHAVLEPMDKDKLERKRRAIYALSTI